jgi:hypothetical protein
MGRTSKPPKKGTPKTRGRKSRADDELRVAIEKAREEIATSRALRRAGVRPRTYATDELRDHARGHVSREAQRNAGIQHVVDWWAKNVGALPRGPVDDPYMLPLFKGGPAARLLITDLSSEASAAPLLRTMVRPNGAHVPSLEELRNAASICRIIGLALSYGEPLAWQQIGKAFGAVFGDTVCRVIVLDAIESLVNTARRIRETREWWEREGLPKDHDADADAVTILRRDAEDAREALVAAHPAFDAVTVDDLIAEVRQAKRGEKIKGGGQWKGGSGNKWTAGIAARLSVQTRAFGDSNVDRSRRAFLNARGRTTEPSPAR